MEPSSSYFHCLEGQFHGAQTFECIGSFGVQHHKPYHVHIATANAQLFHVFILTKDVSKTPWRSLAQITNTTRPKAFDFGTIELDANDLPRQYRVTICFEYTHVNVI